MTEKPITAKDVEEAFGKVDFEKLIGDNILKKSAEELLMPASYGSSFADIVSHEENDDRYIVVHPDAYKYLTRKSHKKIKRRLYYDVYYWTKTDRVSKYFESAKKAKNYVNYIHNSNLMEDGGYVRMEKTFCYREHSPRHKWFYISEKPDTFICAEKY
jgi:hypothetical protein